MDRRLPRDEDGLAPDRGLSGGRPSGPRGRLSPSRRSPARGPAGRAARLHPGLAPDGLGRAARPRILGRPVPGASTRASSTVVARGRHHADGPRAVGAASRARSCRKPRGASRVGIPPSRDGLGVRKRVGLAPRTRRGRDAGGPRGDIRAGGSLDDHPAAPGPAFARSPRRGAPAGPQGACRASRPRRRPAVVARSVTTAR